MIRDAGKGESAVEAGIFFRAQVGRSGNTELVRGDPAIFQFSTLFHHYPRCCDFGTERHSVAVADEPPEEMSRVDAAAGFVADH